MPGGLYPEAPIEHTDPGDPTQTGPLERTVWEHVPPEPVTQPLGTTLSTGRVTDPDEPANEEDPTVLVPMHPDAEPDGSDLHVPTRRSFPVVQPLQPLAEGFDEVPPAQALTTGDREQGDREQEDPERTHQRLPDAEAQTLLRRHVAPARGVVVRAPRARRRPESPEWLTTAAKSAVAGLIVGLAILVPVTLMVIWSSY